MIHRRHDRADRSAVTLQLVRDQAKRNLPLTLQELEKEALRCMTVASGLDEDVDQVAVLIDRTPEILPLAVDRNEDLVQVPRVSEAALSSFEIPRVIRTEFQTPLPDGFVRNDDPALREQVFDIAKAQAEPIIVPDGVTDYFGRESMSAVAVFHLVSLPPAVLT